MAIIASQQVAPLHILNFTGRELDVTINNFEASRSIMTPDGSLTWPEMQLNAMVRIHDADKTESLSRVVFDGSAVVATLVDGKPTLVNLSGLKEPGSRYRLNSTTISPYSSPESGTDSDVLPMRSNLPAHSGTRFFTTDWDEMRKLWQRSRIQYGILNQATHPEKTRRSAFAPDLNFRLSRISAAYEVPIGFLNSTRREGQIAFEHNATTTTAATDITLLITFRYPLNEEQWASSNIVVQNPKDVWTLSALFDDASGHGMTVTNVDSKPVTLDLRSIKDIGIIGSSFNRTSLGFTVAPAYKPELMGNPEVFPTAHQRFFTLTGLDKIAALITPKSTAVTVPPMTSIRILNPTGVPLTVKNAKFADGSRAIFTDKLLFHLKDHNLSR